MSAIVVTSSGLGCRPIAGSVAYSCTKTFASFLAQSLSYELAGKIDCLDWACGEVRTKMLGGRKSYWMVDTEAAVKGVLKNLGKTNSTHGALKHEVSMSMMNCVPLRYLNPMFLKVMEKTYLRHLESGKAERKEA